MASVIAEIQQQSSEPGLSTDSHIYRHTHVTLPEARRYSYLLRVVTLEALNISRDTYAVVGAAQL